MVEYAKHRHRHQALGTSGGVWDSLGSWDFFWDFSGSLGFFSGCSGLLSVCLELTLVECGEGEVAKVGRGTEGYGLGNKKRRTVSGRV